MGNTFQERAGTAGYDDDGWATRGLEGSRARDESRRGANDERNIQRVAQQNAKKALRSGDMAGWQQWSGLAGGRTFSINDSDQMKKESIARNQRNVEDAANLRGDPRANNGVAANNAVSQNNQPIKKTDGVEGGINVLNAPLDKQSENKDQWRGNNGADGGGLRSGSDGNGLGGSRYAEARQSLSDVADQRTDQLTRDGVFGSGAKKRLEQREEQEKKMAGMDEKKSAATALIKTYMDDPTMSKEQAEAKVKELGGTNDSFYSALKTEQEKRDSAITDKEKADSKKKESELAREALRQKNNAEILGKAREEGRLAPIDNSNPSPKVSSLAEMDAVFNDKAFNEQQANFNQSQSDIASARGFIDRAKGLDGREFEQSINEANRLNQLAGGMTKEGADEYYQNAEANQIKERYDKETQFSKDEKKRFDSRKPALDAVKQREINKEKVAKRNAEYQKNQREQSEATYKDLSHVWLR